MNLDNASVKAVDIWRKHFSNVDLTEYQLTIAMFYILSELSELGLISLPNEANHD